MIRFTGWPRGRTAAPRGLCPITRPTRRARAQRMRPIRQLCARMRVRAFARRSPITFGTRQRTEAGGGCSAGGGGKAGGGGGGGWGGDGGGGGAGGGAGGGGGGGGAGGGGGGGGGPGGGGGVGGAPYQLRCRASPPNWPHSMGPYVWPCRSYTQTLSYRPSYPAQALPSTTSSFRPSL